MNRINMLRRGPVLVAPDTKKALDRLEDRAQKNSLKVSILPSSWNPEKTAREHSMTLAGREVRMTLPAQHLPGNFGPQERLAMLWGLAVPAGFTPWLRHPLPGPQDDVFHYFGPWQTLYDRLCSEGKGELAWPSVCAAAQVDIGEWKGDRTIERFVQAQLHRLGVNAGPLNGVIQSELLQRLDFLGIRGLPLKKVAERLALMEDQLPARTDLTRGHIVIRGRDTRASAYGGIGVVKTNTGYNLDITGSGRVILDIV